MRDAVLRYLALLFTLFFFDSSPAQEIGPDLSRLSVGSWKTAGPPEVYKRDSLYGYINGGAEIFLQYGFEELSVARFIGNTAPVVEKEITLEIYRMASPADAFGIFSLKREGNERTSPEIEAVHWLSASQAGLVKGDFYINITGMNATEEEIEAFTAAASTKIGSASALPPELSLLPSGGRIQESERYVRGRLAAEGESLLLDREFWGFGEGTVAVSARYGPSRTKLVIVIFGAPVSGLAKKARELFSEYLEEVAVKDGQLAGKNAAGSWFLFRSAASRAFLVLGEPEYEAAARLIRDAGQK
ncbi:MAG: DUF6599 family protein [Candidatus Aminicenantales bacterium]